MFSKNIHILRADLLLLSNCIIWKKNNFFKITLLPNIFYFNNHYKSFLFSMIIFKKFFKFFFYNSFFFLHFFRLKLRGLGYRFKKISTNIWKLFFNIRHYIYLFLPFKIFLFYKKKKLLLLSFDKNLLNLFINSLIISKAANNYNLKGFIKSRQIIFLKETAKKF